MRSHRRGMLLIDILLIILALFFLLRQISSAGAAFTDTEWMQLRMQAGIWETNTPTASLTPGKNCTHSMGFWKNHPEAWPVENMVLGGRLFDLEAGLELLNAAVEGEPEAILARQLLAAKLNALAGAETLQVAEIIAQAVEWLTAHHDQQQPERQVAISLAERLDAFNRGEIGPGVCEDDSDVEGKTPREMLEETPKGTQTVERTPTVEPAEVKSPQPTDQDILVSETPVPEWTTEPTSILESTEQAEPEAPTETAQPAVTQTEAATVEIQPTEVPGEEGDAGQQEAAPANP